MKKVNKLKSIPQASAPPPSTITLLPEDLQEFHLRRTAFNQSKFQTLMMEEAYTLWSRNLRIKYNIPTEKFEIHPTTGAITPKKE